MKRSGTMNRRLFLRGVGGLTLGLPTFSSLNLAWGQEETAAPKRFFVMMTFNGVEKSNFWPNMSSGTLSSGDLQSTSLSPLAAHASDVFIPRGVNSEPGHYRYDDHQNGSRNMLTSQDMGGNGLYPAGPSIDWAIANALGEEPLNLGVQTGSGDHRFTSIREGLGPVATEDNPRLAYESFIQLGNAPAPVQDKILTRRQSILDLVAREEFDELFAKSMSVADRQKLQNHFDLVRDVENQIGDLGGGSGSCQHNAEIESEIYNNDNSYPAVGKAMLDIAALAMSCSAHRVVTLQWNATAGGPTFNWEGMNHPYRHHPLSHRSTQDSSADGNFPEAEGLLREIDTWYAGRFAYLLEQLKNVSEGEGTVLDNSMMLWANSLSDGRAHSHQDMPYVIAGKLGGYIRSGRFEQANGVTHSQIYTTALNGMGIPSARFGTHGNAGEFSALKS